MKAPRWLRLTLKVSFALIVVLSLFMIGVSWYASSHKKEILRSINQKFHKNINGELDIESMSLSFLQDFPGVSVVLHNTSLRDTQWYKHHTDLINISTISVDLNPVQLLSGKIRIKRIRLEDGLVNLFTDSNEYSNASALQFQESTTGSDSTLFDKIQLSNITLNYEYRSRAKHFRFNIIKLKTKTSYNKGYRRIVADVQTKFEAFSFNTLKGSFLKGQVLSGKINMDYVYAEKILKITNQNIRIDKRPVKLSIALSLAQSPLSYKVNLSGSRVMFHEAMSWLTPAIASNISFLKIARPAEIYALIEGKVQYKDTPLVYVHWKTRNNEIVTPVGKMEKCSFHGYYLNHVDKYAGYSDNNSMVALYDFKTTWLRIPIEADSIKVFDLKQPFLQCNVKANFPARLLNPIIGGESFLFEKGNAKFDINYSGGLKQSEGKTLYFNGFISLSDAAVRYIPRNLVFKNCNALLELNGADLLMKSVHLETDKTNLSMNGVAPGFFRLFYRSPKDIGIRWNVNSDSIDLMEFNSFLQPRVKKPEIIKNTSSVAKHLDQALDACTVDLDVNVKRLRYKNFLAEDIYASIVLADKDINLQHVSLKQSGGTIEVNGGVVSAPGKKTAFNVHAHINDVSVDRLFTSFNNFGQQSITKDNIRGTFSANVYVEGLMHSKSKIAAKTMSGLVDFELKQGGLVHFKPLEKIGKIVFKKRNLSNVTFKDIKNTFYLEGDKIIISPMRIESSALNIGVEGVFSYNTGTNISLEIPLRNPMKDEIALENPRRKKAKRGIVLYLKAIDGKDGNVMITWDKEKQK